MKSDFPCLKKPNVSVPKMTLVEAIFPTPKINIKKSWQLHPQKHSAVFAPGCPLSHQNLLASEDGSMDHPFVTGRGPWPSSPWWSCKFPKRSKIHKGPVDLALNHGLQTLVSPINLDRAWMDTESVGPAETFPKQAKGGDRVFTPLH